ncbi:hypothetical protein GCM10027597_10210 [Saccharopolyspora tripterygii]
MGDSSPKRKVNQARKRAARAYQAQYGCSYRQALQAAQSVPRRTAKRPFPTASKCANPECTEPTYRYIDASTTIINFRYAHIYSASPSGPRHDPTIPNAFSDTDDNILLLCPACHKNVDSNPEEFPDSLLTLWKKEQMSGGASTGRAGNLRHNEDSQ